MLIVETVETFEDLFGNLTVNCRDYVKTGAKRVGVICPDDLGQIVIASLHPDLLERITKVVKDKGVPARMLENFSVGLNHAEVGALIAKKWNFPEQLVTAIRFHHEPLQAPPAARDIVFCVYLANAICDMERERIGFDQVQAPVLKDFGIETEEQLNKIQEKLAKLFDEQRQKFQ